MLRRIAGEGMRQKEVDRHEVGVRAVFVRTAAGVALVTLVCGATGAHAQTYGSDRGTMWDGLSRMIGADKPDADAGINYTERSPLVVPPTRDLPAPGSATAVPIPDWPTDPVRRSKASKSKTAVIPNTAVQTPNPQIEKKPWYNPMGWFDKEEYANFIGEPVRRNLTDPPIGYRVPSPDQPYGIAPVDKGKARATAEDFNMGAVTPPAGGSGH